MCTHSVCFAGIRSGTKTGVSSSFYFPSSSFFLFLFFSFVPPISFPLDFLLLFFSAESQFHCAEIYIFADNSHTCLWYLEQSQIPVPGALL